MKLQQFTKWDAYSIKMQINNAHCSPPPTPCLLPIYPSLVIEELFKILKVLAIVET